jgi:hypothetical protein
MGIGEGIGVGAFPLGFVGGEDVDGPDVTGEDSSRGHQAS